jgi:3(or 17)beta-hydroxysteroid dehydrogenase
VDRLANKVALVTGAASGLGQAIATRFVAEGARVMISDINVAAGERVARELGARFITQDVSDEAVWKTVLDETVQAYGELHILVNNAGIEDSGNAGDPENTTMASWQGIMAVNAGGVFLGCKHAIPVIRSSGGGSIVNMSSIAALVATPFITAYGASKAAVRQLTMSVALHCAENAYNIRCNSVHPGQIMTPMLQNLFTNAAKKAGTSPDLIQSEFLKRIPLGNFGEPDDIANSVLFLASDESKHITGEQLVVDGGMNMNP